jgi:site-specific DNA-methyltransferase (adenine-specific)
MKQRFKTFHGDCLDVMSRQSESSVDSVVCDPPYGLSFMGKHWDHGIPGPVFWQQALRVAKPGAHLLAFGGTRTFHRLACAIEDAGWEIRDCLMWVYGSGFPKSLDVSKAIDKAAGAEREVVGSRIKAGIGGSQTFAQDAWTQANRGPIELDITAPATESAKQWQGWGTALKPAWEPVLLARKPFDSTVAANVLKHGTGAINVDGCRIGTDAGWAYPNGRGGSGWHGRESLAANLTEPMAATQGRWPANFTHDGSDEVTALLGDAARFFYCAKASRKDRGDGNSHPTVKPCDLMRYLCRLVTPPNGIILDPFMGSGSTGKAAILEGFRFVGIEKEAEHFGKSNQRLLEAQTAFLAKGVE